jgi:hypothetical protein
MATLDYQTRQMCDNARVRIWIKRKSLMFQQKSSLQTLMESIYRDNTDVGAKEEIDWREQNKMLFC